VRFTNIGTRYSCQNTPPFLISSLFGLVLLLATSPPLQQLYVMLKPYLYLTVLEQNFQVDAPYSPLDVRLIKLLALLLLAWRASL